MRHKRIKEFLKMRPQRNPALPSRVQRMNLRQRKKQRVGEFTEMGFSLQAALVADLTPEAQDVLLDAWLEAVDQQQVSFGGQFDASGTLEGVVFPVCDVKVSDEVRVNLLDWLKGRSEIASLTASGLFDIWHED
jgi:hypothetical protein